MENDLIRQADSLHFPIHRPYFKLTDREKEILWHGAGDFEGIDGFFAMLEANQYKIQYRVMLADIGERPSVLCAKAAD